MKHVVVVGAGMAGIVAAWELTHQGSRVTVLERAPDVGGRMCTQRVGVDRVDAGAPFFTVRDASFRNLLDPFIADGTVRSWVDRLHRWDGKSLTSDPLTAGERRFAAPEGMASLLRALANPVDVRLNATVTSLCPSLGGWSITTRSADAALAPVQADAVVMAVPAPEALALISSAEGFVDEPVKAELERVVLEPCLVLLAGYPATTGIPWRGIASSVEPLQWIGLESSKRPSSEVLVAIHASAEWSRSHWETHDSTITSHLIEAGAAAGGDFLHTPRWVRLKRWRYARPTLLANSRALLSEQRGPPILFCGDWCVAPRVEGAFLSGSAAADRLIFAGLL